MALYTASLNSGSNGNCYYVGNDEEAVLIDGGLSCRETEKRMRRLELSMRKVKAIFITHEHSDHINGVRSLTRKYHLPVYITEKTLQNSRIKISPELIASFAPHEPIRIGNLTITGFPKIHDAIDPYNFIIANESVKVGVFTDIGIDDDDLIQYFKQCHAAYLEANYDEDLLEKGSYPMVLKNRIRGGKGHLSNVQAAEFYIRHRPAFMNHLFLSHLSQHNNAPRIVENLFSPIAGPTKIVIATRYQETQVFKIENATLPEFIPQPLMRRAKVEQLRLF